ncbi:hypothetical protein BBF96_01725 [Anoxybacter fermentans]|uniref:Uncharacterized protein n=1 Tax=Anoxybacter fermentans TaxID=1323375 RepID=A0A3Q9HNY7_9FIRM|nr:hypothetical protein [Anoxybacter fermentans]AZR72226.1 hypothetical protein BBF96_01725 [Anoxybacter fermentans]
MKIIEKVKNRNYLMIVKVKVEDLKIPIIIPIPLGIVEDILVSLTWLFQFGVRFLPQFNHIREIYIGPGNIKLKWNYLFDISVEFFRELRKIGKFTFIEIKEEDVYVSIKFY